MNNCDSYVVGEAVSDVFWNLWNKNSRDLYRKCLGMMNWDRDDAEDALSTAMIHAFEKHNGLSEEIRNYRAWLFRITHNVCIDIIRKRKGHLTVSYDGVQSDELIDREAEKSESAESVYEEDEVIDLLSNRILSLPDRLKKPLLLTVFTDMSSDEVATKLKINNANLRKRVQLARNRVSTELFAIPEFIDRYRSFRSDRMRGFENLRYEAGICSSFVPREIESDYSRVRIFQSEDDSSPFLQFTSCRGYSAEELESLKLYISKYPGGWKKRLELAEHYFSEGEFEQALFELESVVRRYDLSLTAYKRLGDIYRIMGRADDAAVSYNRAVRVVQKESSKKFFQALIALTGDYCDESEFLIRDALILEADNPAIYNTAGEIALLNGDRCLAKKRFSRALELDSEDLKALVYLHIISFYEAVCSDSVFRYGVRIKELDKSLNISRLNNIVMNRGISWGPGVGKLSGNFHSISVSNV